MEECKNPRCMKRLRDLKEELNRVRSVGFDMLKQRGSWQAAGTEPTQIGMEFDSLFTHEVEETVEILARKSEISENEARKFLSTAFQDVYGRCKEAILNQMRETLSRVLVLPKDAEDDEDLYDICRAYGLLLNVCCKTRSHLHSHEVTHSKELLYQHTKSLEEFKDLTEKMEQLSWQMLETVPPLVTETIADTPFCKDWHEKELHPEWREELADYSLVYYRPILFFSYEGKVAQKGWVGNTPASSNSSEDKSGASVSASASSPSKVTGGNLSYKRPHLRVRASPREVLEASEQTCYQTAGASITTLTPDVQLTDRESVNNYSSDYSFGLKKY